MHLARLCLILGALVASAPAAGAQRIIAQLSGLSNPDHVIDFGANLYPNFASITNQFAGITVTHARYFTTGTSTNLVGGFLTNDPIGQPDTLRIRFAQPISALSFVYHQIGTWQPSVFRAVYRGALVDTFSNLSNQTQLNNYFGFTDQIFDELQLDFVADFNVDTLAYNDVHAQCTFRNGTGVNPSAYRCVTLPVLGTLWQSVIATTPNTIATLIAVAPGGPLAGLPLLGGELLIQLVPQPIFFTGAGTHALLLPSSPWFLGQVATQGLRIEAVGPTQIVELLNAQDLTLGF